MANAFETGDRKVIPAVLIYVRQGSRVLMIHRDGRKTSGGEADFHSGRWNGLGGKLELDESPLEAARRELREESGLDLPAEAFTSLGVVQFPNFKAHKREDWMVFLFVARLVDDDRRPLAPCAEGELHWVEAADVMKLNLWPGDVHFLPQVLEGRPVMGTVWYRGAEVTASLWQ